MLSLVFVVCVKTAQSIIRSKTIDSDTIEQMMRVQNFRALCLQQRIQTPMFKLRRQVVN